MKQLFVSVTAGLVLMGSLNPLEAAPQTNLVQSLHFNLTAYLQGGPVTNQDLVSYSMTPRKFFTPDIIQVIGISMSHQFSPKATLLAVTPLSGAPATIVIQDGTNRVDVTGFFVINKDNVGNKVFRNVRVCLLQRFRGVIRGEHNHNARMLAHDVIIQLRREFNPKSRGFL